MNRIRDYTFSTITVLAVLFIFGGYFLLQDKNNLIETTQKELAGLDIQHELLELMLAAQTFRGTSDPALAANPHLQKLHADSQNTIKGKILKSDALISKQMSDIKTKASWEKIKSDMSSILQNPTFGVAGDFFSTQTKNIRNIIDLMRDVGDDTTLILDPEMASYYLIDLVISLLPQTIEYIAYNRGNITRSLDKEKTVNAALTVETDNILSQYNLVHTSLVRDAEIIRQYKKGDVLPGPSASAFKDIHHYYLVLISSLSGNQPPSSNVFFENSTTTINAYRDAFNNASNALEQLLRQRIATSKQDRLITILFLMAIYFSLVAVTYVAISNYVEKEEVLAAKNLKKLTEQLEKSNVELEHFAHVASHDLKEPLRTISSFSKLMQQKYAHSIDDTGREYLDIMIKASLRMQQMVSDLLNYAQVNYGTTQRQSFDCADELKIALENLHQPIKETGAQITWDNMPTIRHHPSEFARIMQNLISNALKYAREGVAPVIHIGFMDRPDAWQFSVTDNGIGIDKKYFEQIFEPFKRLHTHQQYEGTGIGLAVSKKMLERLGGKIWLNSTPGKGSTFYFTLMKDSAGR